MFLSKISLYAAVSRSEKANDAVRSFEGLCDWFTPALSKILLEVFFKGSGSASIFI